MNNSIEKTQVQVKNQAISSESVNATTDVSKVFLYSIGAVSSIIGLWSFACIVGGMISSGGPLALAIGYFSAISGA